MRDRLGISWSEINALHAVRLAGNVLGRRWNLGLGLADAAGGELRPPRPRRRSPCQVIQDREAGDRACCAEARAALGRLADRAASYRCHAGLTEIAAPIRVGGETVAALVCGGFVPGQPDDDRDALLAGLDERAGALAIAPDAYRRARAAAPVLPPGEAAAARDLVIEAAAEISAHLEPVRAAPPADLARGYSTRYTYDHIVGRSEPMQELYRLLDRVIHSESTVLIQGENGTGKELVARAIHMGSPRRGRRFVVQNCSAFNDNLLDSELFGHKRGAFTGAVADKRGLFEVADQGTFFLDEIGDMSPALQVKVLRVLQEGTYTPVGDTESRRVDVRVIAATNRNLEAMVARGEFREDLYYRINVINLQIPSLRERQGDVDLLLDHFLARHARGPRSKKRLSPECRERLLGYPWPGNVRELENEIERLVVLSGDERAIAVEHLSPRIQASRDGGGASPRERSLPSAVAGLERAMIAEALERTGGNKTHAAAELSISRRNLIRLVQKYEL